MNDSLEKPIKIAAGMFGIVLMLMAAYAAYDYVYHTLPPQQVSISVQYSPDNTCKRDSPIYMLITNDSSREIIGTSFNLSVKKESDNDNFIQLLAKNYATDTVIKAGDSYGGCWSYPKLNTRYYAPENLIYEIDRKQIMFRS